MKTLHVELGRRSYPIHIGRELLGREDLIAGAVSGTQVMIVSNETVAPLYLEKTLAAFSNYECQSVILPDGEQYKNLQTLDMIFESLLSHHFDRHCTLVALGGGVVGDMCGFAAACYQRGVPFIQIPTTLLAQVDSSVGGKTGVNHALGKNMIGAFHQPQAVIIDTDTLETLDDRQLSSGLAEVIKYGLIQKDEFSRWLEQQMDKLLARDPAYLAEAIETSCQCKADIVAADEKESGVRALLNLGHSFGHAIETGTGYGNWLHGEAVAVGMLMAADLSMREGWLNENDVKRVEDLIDRANLPTRAPSSMNYARFMELMAVDKKVRAGKINLVLYHALGDAFVTDKFDPQKLEQTIKAHRAVNGDQE